MVCMSKLSNLPVFSILKQFTHCLLKVKFSLLFCLFFVYLVFWPWRKAYGDANSPARDGTRATTVKVPIPTTESPGNSLHCCLKMKPSLGGVGAGKRGHTHTHKCPIKLQANSHTSFWWHSLSLTHFCIYHRINRTKLTFDLVQLLSNDHHKKCKSQCGTRSFV